MSTEYHAFNRQYREACCALVGKEVIMAVWSLFTCSNSECDWSCPGTFDLNIEGCLPDTDCPKCGYHDSITCSDCETIEEPKDLDEVRKRIIAVDLPYGVYWLAPNPEETVAYKAAQERLKARGVI